MFLEKQVKPKKKPSYILLSDYDNKAYSSLSFTSWPGKGSFTHKNTKFGFPIADLLDFRRIIRNYVVSH